LTASIEPLKNDLEREKRMKTELEEKIGKLKEEVYLKFSIKPNRQKWPKLQKIVELF